MSINTDKLKSEVEHARGTIALIGLNKPSMELKQALLRSDLMLENFLNYELPAIITAEAE